MCGVCGIVSYDGCPVDPALIRGMCNALRHRGPDDEGMHIKNAENRSGYILPGIGLGHCRLSVIDLSSSGRQPMCNEDGSVWITYNGEIYNYPELRTDLLEKGHIFKSDTDTEVIIHLYEEDGLQSIERLNGMFAFALWDDARSRLWVCRDRLGVKPLVYHWDGVSFTFASEIKALLKNPSIKKEMDEEALSLYLAFNYVPAPLSIFKDINKLEPGHFLILENQRIDIRRYWDIHSRFAEAPGNPPRTEHEYKHELFELLDDAVGMRMMADVPLGAFLSGGIDSSIVTALMTRRSARPVKTFSIGFKNDRIFDETRYAKIIVDHYKTDHREFKLTSRDMQDVLPYVLNMFDEPFADSSAIPTYIVSRETRNHVTVALSGEGGDELFAGYRSYLGPYWHGYYRRLPAILTSRLIEPFVMRLPDGRDRKLTEFARQAKKFINSAHGAFAERVLRLKEVFPRETRHRILRLQGHESSYKRKPALNRIQKYLDVFPHDQLNRILYLDAKDSLPGDMLNKMDWMSMKNSLEVRVPFLDHRIVELAFRMPGSLKIRQGRTKYILKETFKNLLPKTVLQRSKSGFEVPISNWLRNDLSFLLDEYLNKQSIRRQGVFCEDTVEKLKLDFMQNRNDTSWLLWNLIVFQHWHDRYFS